MLAVSRAFGDRLLKRYVVRGSPLSATLAPFVFHIIHPFNRMEGSLGLACVYCRLYIRHPFKHGEGFTGLLWLVAYLYIRQNFKHVEGVSGHCCGCSRWSCYVLQKVSPFEASGWGGMTN